MFRKLNLIRLPVFAAEGDAPAATEPAASGSDTPSQPSLLSNAPADGASTADGPKNAAPQTEPNAPQAKPAQGADPSTNAKPTDGATEPAALFDIAALTLPEGVAIDEATSKAFATLLNDAELSPQERGQKLFDLYTANTTALQTSVQEAQVAAWTDLNNTWRAEVDALPEFKGKVEGELAAIKQVLTGADFKAPKEFFSALDLTGAGNNPAILQMLHKLVAPYREGKPVIGDAAVQAGSRLSAMYPTMKPKE